MNKEEALLRAAEIAANNAVGRDAVERAKAAEILPVMAGHPVPDEAVAESREALKTAREAMNHLHGQRIVADAPIADLTEQRTSRRCPVMLRQGNGSTNSAGQR